jgi:hypothetical protein
MAGGVLDTSSGRMSVPGAAVGVLTHRPVDLGGQHSSRRPLSALPTISSESLREYTSAVSTRLIPEFQRPEDDPDAGVLVGVGHPAEHHAQAAGADLNTGPPQLAHLHGAAVPFDFMRDPSG